MSKPIIHIGPSSYEFNKQPASSTDYEVGAGISKITFPDGQEGTVVRLYREMAGLPRDDVASAAGIDPLVYLMLEEGDMSPMDLTVRQISKLAQTIGIPPHRLLE